MAKNKVQKPRARLPRGFGDRAPADIRRTNAMMETIRTVYERWGFEPVETPFIEYADALGKFLPDADRPNEGVFAFQDDDDAWLSLRYDLTAPLARFVAGNFDRIPKPYKSYRAGWVFRNEKPGPGRFRQFMQFDADIVGAASPLADAEICMMAADTMEALGFSADEFVVRVNSRKLLDNALEALRLGGDAAEGTRLTILRSIDKADKLPEEDIRLLLGPGRKDPSGDFTPGAGLSDEQIDVLIRLFVHFKSPAIDLGVGEILPSDAQLAISGSTTFEIPTSLIETSGFVKRDQRVAYFDNVKTATLLGETLFQIGGDTSAAQELLDIATHLSSCGYGTRRIKIDPSVVRGLEYYTGAVFEAELTFETTDDAGRPVRFGSVGGGGRYDGLVGRFISQNVPATGFSVGVSRLAAALALRDPTADKADGPVIVTVMDREELPRYQALTAKLRAALNAGTETVPVELYVGDAGMKAQLKYADRRNAPAAIIQGSDERERGVVQVKDLAAGAEAAQNIDNREDWVAARPAQAEVADDVEAIAAHIKTILAG